MMTFISEYVHFNRDCSSVAGCPTVDVSSARVDAACISGCVFSVCVCLALWLTMNIMMLVLIELIYSSTGVGWKGSV